MTHSVDVSKSVSPHSIQNRAKRVMWGFVYAFLFRPSPRVLHGWRRFLLGMFGAKIGKGVHIYPRAKIWAPWNLEMAAYSCLADDVDCYCVDRIRVGANSTVSQYSYLCTASHDYTHEKMPLVTAPIDIGHSAWIAADVFVGPGVVVGDGAVIGARSSVYKKVEPWCVVAGNPARRIKDRIIK